MENVMSGCGDSYIIFLLSHKYRILNCSAATDDTLGKLKFSKRDVKRACWKWKTPACMVWCYLGTKQDVLRSKHISPNMTVHLSLHSLCIQIASCPCDEMQNLHNIFHGFFSFFVRKNLGSVPNQKTNKSIVFKVFGWICMYVCISHFALYVISHDKSQSLNKISQSGELLESDIPNGKQLWQWQPSHHYLQLIIATTVNKNRGDRPTNSGLIRWPQTLTLVFVVQEPFFLSRVGGSLGSV